MNIQKKFIILSLTFSLFSIAFSAPSEAKPKQGKQTTSTKESLKEPSVSSSDQSPTSTSLLRQGFGFASFSNLGGSSTALSTWLDLDSGISIQGLFAIGSTSPFEFGIGGMVRKIMHGNEETGLHLGGGLHLGTSSITGSSKFYISVVPVGGFHFLFPGTKSIGFSFDGGPVFEVRNSTFNFSTVALSPLLGLSIHYFL